MSFDFKYTMASDNEFYSPPIIQLVGDVAVSIKQKEIHFYKVLKVSQTLNGMFGWEILRSI